MSKKQKNTPRSPRRPLADLGLMVAIALCLVFGLRLAIFGLTFLSLVILALSVAYCAVSAKCDSHSRLFARLTVAFLLLTAGVMLASVYLDRPTRPKRTAFQPAERTDTVAEETYVVETPAPAPIDSSDTDEPDSIVQVLLPDTLPADIEMPGMDADTASALF